MNIKRKDNKKGSTWILNDTIRITTSKNDNQLKAKSNSIYITPFKFTKKSTYIKSVPDEDLELFIDGLIDKIEYALDFGGNPKEITSKLRDEYQGKEQLEKEVVDIKTEFKKVMKEFDCAHEKMINLCKKVEML